MKFRIHSLRRRLQASSGNNAEKPIAVGETAGEDGDELAAVGNNTLGVESTDKPLQHPPQSDNAVEWLSSPDDGPTPDAGFSSRLVACADKLIGLRLVATYRDFVSSIPERLNGSSFQPRDWVLHPRYSWSEISKAILDEHVSVA
jgi:hypothetical protein